MMRKGLVPVIALVIAGAFATSVAAAEELRGRNDDDRGRGGNRTYAIGLWGDMPYSALQASVGVPNLIADMNSQDLAFTAHDGDLKSGSSACTDETYTQALSYLNSLEAPAIFRPGDNDWTDCDRIAGVSSLAQLDKERALFFQHPVYARTPPSPPDRSVLSHLPGREWKCVLRRESPLDGRQGDVRNVECAGLLQQPVRYRARPGRVRCPQCLEYRLVARDIRSGKGAQFLRGHIDLAGRSWLR